MEFEQWVAAQGFDVNALTEPQSTSLRALFGERLKAEDRRLKAEGISAGRVMCGSDR